MTKDTFDLAILGAGNIGRAIAVGLADSGGIDPQRIILTRRNVERLADLAGRGFHVTADNLEAVRGASQLLIAVEPQQLDALLAEIGPRLDPDRHRLVSVVSGASVRDLETVLGVDVPVVRAMPNTAIAIGKSMTCLAADPRHARSVDAARAIFDAVGTTVVIQEELMMPATALCACGVAFFLRSIRAASQGGIEIGFHPEDALKMAAQTALGAAALVLGGASHPEHEVDRVTTPRGCTISGLNELEHRGFSSALIKGIVTSAEKASDLYAGTGGKRRKRSR
jgi:pyrroline-5-carboxylate reductase